MAAGVAWRWAVAVGSQPLGNDSFHYLLLARSIAEGRGYVAGGSQHPDLTRSPALPVATAAAYPITGDVETAGLLVSALSGALLVLPLAAVARSFGRRAMWAAIPLAAVSCVVAASSRVLPEPLFMLLAFSAAALAWRGSAVGRPSLLFGAGILAGGASLARIEGLGWIAMLALWALYGARKRRGTVRAAALVLVGAAVVYLPYDGWVAAKLGRFLAAPEVRYLQDMRDVADRYALRDAGGPYMVWSDRARLLLTADHRAFVLDEVFRTGTFPEADEIAPAPRGPEPTAPKGVFWYHVAKRRWSIVRGNLRGLPDTVLESHLVPWTAAALAAIGLVGTLGKRRRRRAWIFLAALVPAVAAPLLSHVEARFLLPGLALLLVPAAAGWGVLDRLLGTLRGGGARPLRAAAHVALVASIALAGWTHTSLQRSRFERSSAQEAAGAWAARHVAEGPLLAVEPAIPYWAGRPYRPIPAAGPDAIHDYARAVGATGLVIEVPRDAYRVPALAPFLETPPPPGFRPLPRDEDGSDGSIRFFAIEDRRD